MREEVEHSRHLIVVVVGVGVGVEVVSMREVQRMRKIYEMVVDDAVVDAIAQTRKQSTQGVMKQRLKEHRESLESHVVNVAEPDDEIVVVPQRIERHSKEMDVVVDAKSPGAAPRQGVIECGRWLRQEHAR